MIEKAMQTICKFNLSAITFIGILCLLVCAPSIAFSARNINDVQLDGGPSTTVFPASSLSISVNVTTSENEPLSHWRSTLWRISSGVETCINEHNKYTAAGNHTADFEIIAPAAIGVYDLEVIAYAEDLCNGMASNVYRMTDAVTVVKSPVVDFCFDEREWNGVVGEVKDSSANDYHATAVNGPTTDSFSPALPGSPGTCSYGVFDGVDDYVALPSGYPNILNDYTITAWIRTTNNTRSGQRILIDDPNNTQGFGFSLGDGGTGRVRFFSRSTNPIILDTPNVIANNLWYFVAAVADISNNTKRIYVYDQAGNQLAAVTGTYSGSWGYDSGDASMGGENDSSSESGSNFHFEGNIDEVRVHTGALSVDQIKAQQNTVRVCARPAAEYRFDLCSETDVVFDDSGNGFDGKVINGPLSIRQGKICNGAYFDGVDDYVAVDDSDAFDNTSELTIAGWINPESINVPPSGTNARGIISKRNNASSNVAYGVFFYSARSDGKLYVDIDTVNDRFASNSIIPEGVWTHFAVVFDGNLPANERVKLYLNGALDVTASESSTTIPDYNSDLYIGNLYYGLSELKVYKGMLDELRVIPEVLSPDDIQTLYNATRSTCQTCVELDHIRIEHDGYASICAPERVTIKACMDSTCSALYPGNVTVNLAPAGWIGGETFSFSGGIVSRQLSRGIPGDVTLGTDSVSPVPSESTRCYIGSNRSCTLNFADVSCAFDAVESGADPQTPLFTKLSGVPFNVDILALLDMASINPNYVNSVNVDLVDAGSSACPLGGGLTSATSIDFDLADAGRKTVSFNYPDAARNVKVRVQAGGSAPACSNDSFAIRPQSLDISTINALNTALMGIPRFAAGDDFNLTATGLSGYDGVPAINNALVSGSPSAGQLAGIFPAANVVNGRSSGDRFTYSEVGHFGLEQYAVYDDNFTAVDQPGDCLAGFSNQLSGGRYGCSFGSQAVPLMIGTSGFGRFVPAYFDITTNNPLLDDGCSGFTYLGQPFTYLISPELTFVARNRAGGVTSNYGGQYWRMNSTLGDRNYANNSTTASSLAISTAGTSLWTDTGNTDGDGIVRISGEALAYSKPTAPEAPFDTNVDLVFSAADLTDLDGVCYDPDLDGNCNGLTLGAVTGGEQRYGRLLLQNSYGPETLALNLPVQAEYYDGAAFVPNSLDQCTPYAALNLQLSNYQGNLVDGDTTASGSGTLLSGRGNNLNLSPPGVGHDGSVDLTLDLSQASGADLEWLQQDGNNPSARATFGIFEGNPRLIYMRESIW